MSDRKVRRSGGKVTEAVERWLAGCEVAGADVVRVELARVLARELDDPEAPRYAKPRVAAELRALLAEMGLSQVDDADAVRRLLDEVLV